MPRQPYDPAEIEPKWQEHWEQNRTFRAPGPGDPGFDPKKPKVYILDMFPYPSGAGLHVGHPEGYTATDILARYRRQRGDNVLHPMGWDAFGLPAEQYAIQTGTHPAITTRKNIDTFRRQIRRLGFSYDWDREIDTTDPKYYRWTQWIFARLFEKGLAYMAEVPVWWCEALGTVLANEEVIDGKSERGSHPCVRKPMRQWMLRITAYAERLLQDLDDLDWPDSIKAMQREWIGRSEGAEVDFPVLDAGGKETGEKIRVFTTRPDTLFGATYMVLAPEHPLVARLTGQERRAEVKAYQEAASRKTELDRTDLAREKSGVFIGAFARNPVFEAGDPRARIPIWIADHVVMGYGTGAIMAVPAHDERDFEFAKAFGLPVTAILDPDPEGKGDAALRSRVLAGDACWSGDGVFVRSSNQGVSLDGLRVEEGKRRIIEWLAARGIGTAKVTYRLRDWLFSRQRYWGEPFPVVHVEGGAVELVPDEELPVLLPEVDDFKPSGKAEAPLAKAKDWVRTKTREGKPALRETNTMPQWAGSCWYYLRFIDPHEDSAPFASEKEKYWMPVDLYVGGAEHAVLHLLYARFWHKVLYDLGLVSTKEPFRKLFNQGMILSYAYSDERGALIPGDDVVQLPESPAEAAGSVSAPAFVHRETKRPVKRIVAKMSKSLKNVVNPDAVIEEYGADTFRLYEMFMGPLEATKPWNPADIPGVHRFLSRVWRLVVPEFTEAGWIQPYLSDAHRAGSPEVERSLHRTIKKVTIDLDRMAFNTAISAMMVFVNDAMKASHEVSRGQVERFLVLLSPFAPHLAEELWSRLGNDPVVRPLAYESWPCHDEALVAEATVEIPVQVNGKLRGKAIVPTGSTQEAVLAAARAAVQPQLAGKQVAKEIVVPGKLVNFVVK